MNHSEHDMHSMNHSSSSCHGSMSHAMVMHTGFKETIVFAGWKTSTEGEFAGTLIAMIIISIIYEGIKLIRELIAEKSLRVCDELESKSNMKETIMSWKKYKQSTFSKQNMIQTVLHCIQFVIGYFLMLAFMISNYWICLAIIIGITLGYFVFGSVRQNKIGSCCE